MGTKSRASEPLSALHRFFKNVGRREMLMEFAGPSKDAHMMAMEMPRVLDHFLHRFEMRRVKGPEPEDGDGPVNADAASHEPGFISVLTGCQEPLRCPDESNSGKNTGRTRR